MLNLGRLEKNKLTKRYRVKLFMYIYLGSLFDMVTLERKSEWLADEFINFGVDVGAVCLEALELVSSIRKVSGGLIRCRAGYERQARLWECSSHVTMRSSGFRKYIKPLSV